MCFSARSVKASGIGRLLVTILEATELKAGKPNGENGYIGCTDSSMDYDRRFQSRCKLLKGMEVNKYYISYQERVQRYSRFVPLSQKLI